MVSLAAYLMYKGSQPLGGVIGLSGMQALADIPKLSSKQLSVLRRTPLFLYHGGADPRQPHENASYTYQYIKEEIYGEEFKENYKFSVEPGIFHSLSHIEL